MDSETLLMEQVAPQLLNVRPTHLERLRTFGDGPAHIRLSHKMIRYRRAHLDRWIETRASLSHTTEVRASA